MSFFLKTGVDQSVVFPMSRERRCAITASKMFFLCRG